MSYKKRALITGVNGQDGSYLSELLLEKGYQVYGTMRRSSSNTSERIQHLMNNPNFHKIYGDLLDSASIMRTINETEPDEIYNLAAQSHVKISFEIPEYTCNVTGLGALRILEATRNYNNLTGKKTKFYQASSSEMFGSTNPPQNELSIFSPRSPYGFAKLMAHNAVINYRDAYDMFAVSGILFNHESPRRGIEFVTKKIVQAAVNISRGKQHELRIGNLDAKRDWGYAKDYVEAMWLMLQRDQPEDYVICTGVSISVRDFCEIVFKLLNLDYKNYVVVDHNFFRPTEVDFLHGDATKARLDLGWLPKVNIDELAQLMVESELSD